MVKDLVTDVNELSIRAVEWDVLANGQKKSVELVQDLCDTLETLDDRLFLTANQIGHKERAFAIKFKDETEVFMNPAIQSKDKLIIYREEDPLTGKEYFIPRFTQISLVFQDCLGKVRGLKMNEAASIIVCQAMDALNGILISDYGLEVLPEFDSASEEEKKEVLSMYAESLSQAYKELDADLSNNEETKKTWGAAKFIKSVSEGETKLEEKPLSNRKKKKLKKFLKLFGKKVK